MFPSVSAAILSALVDPSGLTILIIAPSQTSSFLFAAMKTPLKYDNFAVGGCQFLDRPGVARERPVARDTSGGAAIAL
jgi:hypothetical protein